MDSKVLEFVNGVNGQLYLYKDKVILGCKGFNAKVNKGLFQKDIEIPIRDLEEVNGKLATVINKGYVEFRPSFYEKSKIKISKDQDPYVITFTKRHFREENNPKVERILDYIKNYKK